MAVSEEGVTLLPMFGSLGQYNLAGEATVFWRLGLPWESVESEGVLAVESEGVLAVESGGVLAVESEGVLVVLVRGGGVISEPV